MNLIENFSIIPIETFLNNNKNIDLFICCGSFEDRSIRCSEILSEFNIQIKTSIIFNYKETDIEKKKESNIKIIKEKLEKISSNIFVFNEPSIADPSKGIKDFIKFINEKYISLSIDNIMIEITVFTKPYFFLLFKILKEIFRVTKFFVVYTEPEKYSSRVQTKEEIILTEGLDRIEIIPGFFGSSIHSKDALIVLLGFEGKRALEVFNDVDPEITYAINGFPSYQPGWDKLSLEANLQFLKESYAYKNINYAPAINPFETMITISNIIEEINDIGQELNIIIAPLGSKMQAFGTLLYAFKNDKVKVIYPFPTRFKTDYSYKYSTTWIFKVNLDSI